MGGGHDTTASVFAGSISSFPLDTTKPRNWTVDRWNSHFSALGEEAILQQSLENEADIGDVFFQGFREDKDAIQVYKDVAINDVTKDFVDQGLEDGRRVRTAWHSTRSDLGGGVLDAVFHSSPSLMRTRW